ncbi:MAG: nucleotidyltransferase domain-containing protein [Microcoleus sp. PH2017_07_MST_O_A]|nr:nucleotidyltransferase domain-containing protein [Microcoleus sp. PH2017_02_FOX_O_A]MCC3416767.1 nucleotidyltransferase domain-containing protein [Microcoleus sp. PH2017_07_MST_O_A]MCC3449494.1 nucleotidyltransferase domain-containing protein [Microcoleus sp. PH2017_09_SFU_O_A]MCC3453985.1 nucleotidyltransferase domain-containing protein [Microcoleus sp. PH2017_08_TRC_O_A]MCC3474542.1 nucleotidyltransferase domain-containing protein [Microcoleus sp. PH2017_13_LAR_U_A]MCC3487036.1 nucleotidy
MLAVALRHGAFNVRVFGSVARGVVDESSDIDLLVDYNGIRIKPFD